MQDTIIIIIIIIQQYNNRITRLAVQEPPPTGAAWAPERTLRGHGSGVTGLVLSGRRLVSSSLDRTVRAWSTEAWECVQAVEAYGEAAQQYVRCLAACGSTLVGGSATRLASSRVWAREVRARLLTLSFSLFLCLSVSLSV